MQSDNFDNIRGLPAFRNLPWKTLIPLTLDPAHLPEKIEPFRSAIAMREGTFGDPLMPLYKPSLRDPVSSTPPRSNNLPLFPLEDKFSGTEKSQLSTSVISYITLDTLASIHGSPENPESLTIERTLPQLRNTHLPMHSLKSWIRLIITANDAMQERQHPPRTLNSYMLQHFLNLHTNNCNRLSLKIIANIEAATMHLKFFLEGNLEFFKDRMTLVKYLHHQNPHVSIEFIEETLRPFIVANLKLPLHAALTLSPLCLLGSRALTSRCVSDEKLCEMWRCYGGQRPALLKNTEARIWQILWDNATGSCDVSERLRSELPDIIKSLIGARERAGPEWFCNTISDPQTRGIESSQIKRVGAQGENNVVCRDGPIQVIQDVEEEKPIQGIRVTEKDKPTQRQYPQEEIPEKDMGQEDQGVCEDEDDDPMTGNGEAENIKDKVIIQDVHQSPRTRKRSLTNVVQKLPHAKRARNGNSKPNKVAVPPVVAIPNDKDEFNTPDLEEVVALKLKLSKLLKYRAISSGMAP